MKLFCLLCFFICLFQQMWAWSPRPEEGRLPDLHKLSSALPDVNMPYGWITYGSKLLNFHIMFGDEVSFWKASAACQRQGSSLMSIQSMKENRYLRDKLQSLPIPFRPISVWIGFHKSPYSTYKWTDGSTPQILNWDIGVPQKHYQERCVEMLSSNGAWSETDCSERRTYICEKPLATTKPTIITTKPTTGTPTPTTVTRKPTTVTPSQTTVTRKSTAVTPKPTAVTPSPTTVTPSPTTVTPKSTTVTPKPTKLTPTPTNTTSMKPIVTVGPEGVIPTPPHHKPFSVILTKMSNYSGSHEQPQEVRKINTFLDLSTAGLVGIIIAIIIVFTLPMVGLVVWKKGRINKLKTTTGFDNSLYQYDTQLQRGQFVPYDRLPEAK